MNSKQQVLIDKLQEINGILVSQYRDCKEIGILTGISGIALFQFYYSKLMNEESNADLGTEILSLIFDKINDGYTTSSFCTGIAGAGWTIELLREDEFIDMESDTILPGLENYLLTSMQSESARGHYDFLHGPIGIGYYFLKRYKNTDSSILKSKYKENLTNLIAILDKSSIKDGDSACWETYLIKDEGLRGYNLGLAHGMSSIINFLSRLMHYIEFEPLVTPLLQLAVNAIISFENEEPFRISCFPDWITTENKKTESKRLAWCYGDLGIALSLWKAGKALKNKDICKKAIEVFELTSYRKDPEKERIHDAGLCHGAYGVMHIYSYMYKETRNSIFKDAADYWLDYALDMAIHKKGYAGYMKWQGGEAEGWSKEINLLEGITGIGLSLISYMAPFKTNWDECLMIT